MRRGVTALLICCMLASLCACRARVDLTVEPELPEDLFTSGTTAPSVVDNDEMAAYAWELYSAALEADKSIESYDVSYEGRYSSPTTKTTTHAHMVRMADGDRVEMLVQTDDMQGYLTDNVGYFQTETDKYWMFIDEDGFMTELGFSDSPTLSEAMFSEALVVENDDGTRTVSCPLSGEYAEEYAARMLGLPGTSYVDVERVEVGVTVDADGTPTAFHSSLSVSVSYYGRVSAESTNTYNAVGDAVTLTPPDGLDSYREANG